jgi:hypothetical protein
MSEQGINHTLLAALKSTVDLLEQANCETGYCCCGSKVDIHSQGDNHSPLDQGAHAQSNAVKAAWSAICSAERYVQCISCGHFTSWLEHVSLHADVSCPDCGARKQFGPGVYVDDFRGYTMLQVTTRRQAIVCNPNMVPIGWKKQGYKFVNGQWTPPKETA